MFKETSATTHEVDTVIGQSVKVEGDFVTDGNIIVEGIICGTIKAGKNLKIGPQAKIYANITADNALIAGEIQGNISVNGKLELASTAKIFGDVKASILGVSSGAAINGKVQMLNAKKSARPEFSKQKKELKEEEIEAAQ